ncbi:MAG: FtsX-like permease family protein [Candidatus Nanopelagicales bacterium]
MIIMAVMANTMTMTARERLAEYATLKALGFSPGFVVRLLFGESLVIALIGGAARASLLTLAAGGGLRARRSGTLLPVFRVLGHHDGCCRRRGRAAGGRRRRRLAGLADEPHRHRRTACAHVA